MTVGNMRLNQCPACGKYSWAHPTESCKLTPAECEVEYQRRLNLPIAETNL